MTGRHLALLVAAGAAVWSVAAEAQPYPARPITIVVPYAAGGVFDTMARIIGARMGELLGQSVIVENVTGAGGIIGVQHVINAKPDGDTVLLGTVGTHAYNQSMYRKRRYDAVSDFTRHVLLRPKLYFLSENAIPDDIARFRRENRLAWRGGLPSNRFGWIA